MKSSGGQNAVGSGEGGEGLVDKSMPEGDIPERVLSWWGKMIESDFEGNNSDESTGKATVISSVVSWKSHHKGPTTG